MSAISLLLVADQSTRNHVMISKMLPKGSPLKKKRAKKWMKKAKKTLITMPTSDSDKSQSLLGPRALGGCLAESDAEDGGRGRGGQL